MDEWLDENYGDWTEQFEDKFNKLFDEHTLRNGGMLTASAAHAPQVGPPRVDRGGGLDQPAKRN